MYVIDSSGWIEHFVDGPNASGYRKYIQYFSKVITPTIVIYEVYKKIKLDTTEEYALTAVALMRQSNVVPLDDSITLSAADISIKYSIPMADSVVYATAAENKCLLVTSDEHFRNLDKVKFIPEMA